IGPVGGRRSWSTRERSEWSGQAIERRTPVRNNRHRTAGWSVLQREGHETSIKSNRDKLLTAREACEARRASHENGLHCAPATECAGQTAQAKDGGLPIAVLPEHPCWNQQ